MAANIAAALRSRTQADVLTEEFISLESEIDQHQSSDSFRVPLAIVGIAGRFPGAEDVEQLWSVLDAGVDLHRIVGYLPVPMNISNL